MTDVRLADAPIAKKRGRPRKERPPEHPMATIAESATLADTLIPKKRGPGRPRKNLPYTLIKPAAVPVPAPPAPAPGPDLDAPAQLDADDFSISHITHDAASVQSSIRETEVIAKKKGQGRSSASIPHPASPTQAEIEDMILQASVDSHTTTMISTTAEAILKLRDAPKQQHHQRPTSPTQAEMDELILLEDGHVDDATVQDDSTVQDSVSLKNNNARARLPTHNNNKRPNVETGIMQLNDDGSEGPSAPPLKRGRQGKGRPPGRCVCTWGEECARFRRFFDRVKEREGKCVFSGTFRPNIGGGERQANFLDAVDRHLSTSQEARQRTSGRYVIAYHHWPANVLEYIKRLNVKSFLVPVSNAVAVELGITSDPADEYQTHVEPDEYGRLRPVRGDDDSSDASENEDEDKQWVLAPSHEYSDVKATVDEGIAKEIEERIKEKREAKRKRQEDDEPDEEDEQEEIETSKAEQDAEEYEARIAEYDARIAEFEQEIADKDARIMKLEEALADTRESNQLLQTQLRALIQENYH